MILHFIFLLVFFNIHLVRSEIQTIDISSDPRPLIVFEDFGFTNQGYISISVTSLSISTSSIANNDHTKSSLMGCFYAPALARRAITRAINGRVCIIGRPFVFPIFTFAQRRNLVANTTIPVTVPDLYYIFFVNCAKNASVSFSVNLETYNVDPINGDRDYTDAHFANLGSTLFAFSSAFFLFLLIWSNACIKHKHFSHRIHLLMALLLLSRFLDLFFRAQAQRALKLTGWSHYWRMSWLVTHFARTVLFVSVVMLISSGWPFLKPCLRESQRRIIGFAMFCQVLASICFLLINWIGPSDKNYGHWTVTFYAADFVSCVTMMFPVHESIDSLRENSKKTEGKEARRLAELRVYGNYELALISYIGFTRLGIFILRSVTSHELWSFTIVLELSIETVFLIVVYLMFWPNERSDFLVLVDKDDEPGSATSVSSRAAVFSF